MVAAACTAGAEGPDVPTDGASEATPSGVARSNEAAPADGTGPHHGGTLHVLAPPGRFTSLDPVMVTDADEAALLSAFVHRTLVTYNPDPDPGRQARLVPDLATDTGRPNADLTEWSFTLRDDVTWADGTPITCADVKYGVSRQYAQDVLTSAARPAVGRLDVPTAPDGVTPVYRGPYDGAGEEHFDEAVTCEGQTITFRLLEPAPDFNETTTLLGFSPVRPDRDPASRDGREPMPSGPYRVADDGEGSTLVLTRRPDWDASSEPARPAYPDRVEVELGVEAAEIDRRLVADDGRDRYAVGIGGRARGPQESDAAASGDAADAGRRWNEAGLQVTFVAIDTGKVPVLEHRRALAVALDRRALLDARGGEQAASIADGIVSPALALDHEPTGFWDGLLGAPVPERGDPARAEQLVARSGEALPPLSLDYPDNDTASVEVQVVVSSLRAAGVDVEARAVPEATYYRTVLDPRRSAQLAWVAWRPDWANASTVLPPLVGSDGTFNLSRYNQRGGVSDPQLQSLIDAALAEDDRSAQAELWRRANARASAAVLALPLTVDRGARVWGSGLAGVYYFAPYESYGYADISVKP